MRAEKTKFNKALQLFNKNKLADARKLLQAITNADARNEDAWLLLGMTEARSGKYENAATCFRNILSITPNSADAHYFFGAALEAQHHYSDAIREYLATIGQQPKYAKAYYNLANIYRVQGLLERAEEYYRSALNVNPHYFEALNNLGSVLKTQSKLAAAIDCFNTALRLKPGDAGILTNLGNTYHLLESYDEANKYYRNALATNPKLSEAIVGLSGALFKKGEKDEALKLLADARQRLPNDDSIIASEASIYEEDGQRSNAYQALKHRIDDKCNSVDIAVAFARLSRYFDLTEDAVNILKEHLDTSLEASDRMRIFFTLGKLYDSLGRSDDAFESYFNGNQLKPLKLDRKELDKKIGRTINIFNRKLISSSPRSDNVSDKPVFVVGMPRSGTSLVEQILSSHPEVHGAGELMDIGMIAASLRTRHNSELRYPASINNITRSDLNKAAERYTGKLDELAPDAKRVIDKMPGNFMHLGLIELISPKARIIHCVRNPMDTCLSCYFTDFLGYHPYSYDLSNLGFYYCQYVRLMKHWKDVISLPFYAVEYEVLVNNQERISRELVEFCGLDWDEQCLRFHETKRLVKTASYDQVRKPMYKSSVGRWKHYRKQLDELVKELGNCTQTFDNQGSTIT